MPLHVHIAGPGLDLVRRLEPGAASLILGRDADCTVCLPDPERNVSRRHLSVWNEGDELHFLVLSVVNGVDIGTGELPPGARGVLPAGEVLAVSDYRLTAALVAGGADTPPADPWTEFERQAAELVPASPAALDATVPDDDPFGDWGFQSTFGPGSPAGELDAEALAPATDLQPFLAGLGLDRPAQGAYTRSELETMGRLTRIALEGVLRATQSAARSRDDMQSEGWTMSEPRELNPLRMDSPLETKLFYLFGGQAAAAGFLPQDRAVSQVVADLASHQQAVDEAVREAVRGVLAEFEPQALKERLVGAGPRVFASSRAWDAFARDYAERWHERDEWVRQLLQRHFERAYAEALVRVKRDTAVHRRP